MATFTNFLDKLRYNYKWIIGIILVGVVSLLIGEIIGVKTTLKELPEKEVRTYVIENNDTISTGWYKVKVWK